MPKKDKLLPITFEKGIDLIRVVLGILLFMKGINFIIDPGKLSFWMESGQMLVKQTLIAHYVIAAHLCGGLLLSVGLLTRIAAAIQVPVLFGAVFFVHMNSQVAYSQNLEYSSLVLVLLLIFTTVGSGNWSLDAKVQ